MRLKSSQYTFDASAGTITFVGVTVSDIEQISPITNGDRGIEIFHPSINNRHGTLSANVLTLEFDTNGQGHADTDKLYITISPCETGVLNVADTRINPATEEKQDAGNTTLTTIAGLDFATQTTLAAILAKIIASPSTEAKQDTINTTLGTILTELQAKADLIETQPVSVASLPLPTGAATEVTLAAILAKIIAAPSTEAKQSAANALLTSLDGKDYATQTTLAALLSAFNLEDFSTETTLAALRTDFNAEDFSSETTLNALLTAFNSTDFATQTTLAALLTAFNAEDFSSETTLNALLTAFNGEDFASETTLNSLLTAFNAEDFATETTLAAINAKAATSTKQDTQITNQGTEGAAPPSIPGTGIIGYLRSVYDSLVAFSNKTLRFKKDTVTTEVEIDTATPANNEPLPTAIYNDKGLQGNNGNPFGVAQFDSQTGSRQIVDLNGAAKMGEAVILAGDAFSGQALSSLLWDTEFVGSGSTSNLPGTQRIQTGTTANSEVRLQSVKAARFMISQFNIAHFGIQTDPTQLLDQDCVRRWGVFDPIGTSENGLFFEVTSLDGINPQWYIVSIKDGVETNRTPQASWNGVSKDLFNPSPTLSVYEIQYNAGTAFFFQGTNFIHKLTGLTDTYAGTYNFKVGLEVVNSNGNTNDNRLDFRAAGVYRLGEERGVTISRVFTADTLIKTGAGYCASVFLSRTGSAGGSGFVEVFDGIDATGKLMARVDVGGDDLKGIPIKSTFSDGLYIDITGSGTNSVTVTFE